LRGVGVRNQGIEWFDGAGLQGNGKGNGGNNANIRIKSLGGIKAPTLTAQAILPSLLANTALTGGLVDGLRLIPEVAFKYLLRFDGKPIND